MVDLIRTNGYAPLATLRAEMDRAFQDMVRGAAGPAPREFPPVNLWEDGESLYAEFELPGMSLEEVQLHLTGNELSLRGERKEPEGQRTWHRRERGTARFARVLRLPVDVDAERVSASLDAGVLLVELPKAAAAKPRRIQVQSR